MELGNQEDLLEENMMLRENIKAIKTLFKKEESRCRVLEVMIAESGRVNITTSIISTQAQLKSRESTMQDAIRTMADTMTGEIEDLRRRLHKYEPPPTAPVAAPE